MRNFISIFVALALTITTAMAPAASHAMPHNSAKTAQTETVKDHDCHGHGAAKADASKTAHNDKDQHGKCCDKGMCKCIGGSCHNALSKILNDNGAISLAFVHINDRFPSSNESVDSASLEGLKRPPRA